MRAGELGVVVFAANAERTPSHAVGRGSTSTKTSPGRRLRLRIFVTLAFEIVPRGPIALRPVENKPIAHGACARWRTWRRCLRVQHGARSTPRRWPRLSFNDTARGWRLRFCLAAIIASSSCAARPAHATPREEPANRPHSTCALADLTWLSSRPTRGALQPTLLAEALLHQHRVRSVATVFNRRERSV